MKSNSLRKKLAYSLQKHGKNRKERIWSLASEEILATASNRRAVNLSEISRNSKEGGRVLIPGKVLAGGNLSHKVTVVAYSFSQTAKEKILASGGKFVGLKEYMESGEDPKGVIVLG